MDLTALFNQDPLKLILIIGAVIAFSIYLGMRIQLLRTQQQGKAQDERAAVETKRLESEGKNSDALIALATSISSRTDLEREQTKGWQAIIGKMIDDGAQALSTYKALGEAWTKQVDRQFGISTNHGESLEAIQDVVQKQVPTLQETHDMVKDLQDKIDKLPADLRTEFNPLFEKIDAEILLFKTEILEKIAQYVAQIQPPVHITNTVTTTPPVDAPVAPPNGGATS